jgi:hypothetical protein
MSVKAILLMAIIVAGAGLVFLIIVGWQWWRAMSRAEDEWREDMGIEGQITDEGGRTTDESN